MNCGNETLNIIEECAINAADEEDVLKAIKYYMAAMVMGQSYMIYREVQREQNEERNSTHVQG